MRAAARLRSDHSLQLATEEEAATKEAKEALKRARLKMAAEEDELLDAEEQAEEQARREAEALAAEAKAAGEQLKKLMKSTNRQDTAKLQVNRAIPRSLCCAHTISCDLKLIGNSESLFGFPTIGINTVTPFVGGNRCPPDGYRRVRHGREGPA